MEFTIAREEFQRALDRVQGIVDKRNTIPLLANVLIQCYSDGMKLTASDMEVAFSGHYSAEIQEEGEVTLGARQLFEIVKSLPQDTVHVKRIENDWVEIRSGKAYFKIVGMSAEGYPAIPTIEQATVVKFKNELLREMIDHTFFSIATDDSRYGLNGAYLEEIEDEEGPALRMVSTDGHRLSLITKRVEKLPGLTDGYLLPRKGLAELRKLCDDFEPEIQAVFSGNAALFKDSVKVFFMRLLEGDFPDYRQVIPQRWQRRLFIDRDELQKALRRVSILSSEKTHSVRFRILPDSLEVSASNPDLGESKESVDARVEGDPTSVGFNARYFMDAINALKDEHLILELGDGLNPGLIRGETRTDVLYVVMPMRLE